MQATTGSLLRYLGRIWLTLKRGLSAGKNALTSLFELGHLTGPGTASERIAMSKDQRLAKLDHGLILPYQATAHVARITSRGKRTTNLMQLCGADSAFGYIPNWTIFLQIFKFFKLSNSSEIVKFSIKILWIGQDSPPFFLHLDIYQIGRFFCKFSNSQILEKS